MRPALARACLGVLGLAPLLLPLAASAQEDAPIEIHSSGKRALRPTASVTLDLTTLSVGIGVSWGKGVLTFENRDLPFHVRGLSLVGVGGASVKATGTVFNLEKAEDFPGAWAQIDGDAVLGKASKGGISLGKGDVYMILDGERKGLKLAAGGGAVTIRFDAPPEPPAPREPAE